MVKQKRLRAAARTVVIFSCVFFSLVGAADAQVPPGTPAPLSGVAVPVPPTLSQFVGSVSSQTVAIELGKALFWDMQTGSDGRQACATCHFNGGIDNRLKNTLNPDTNGPAPGFNSIGPNGTLKASDFPFTVPGVSDTHVIVGSQGVFDTTFTDIKLKSAKDLGVVQSDTTFQVGGIDVRRVTPRNAPSIVNAVFNHRNFWDGRAKNVFNGASPFGNQDPDPQVFQEVGSSLEILTNLRLTNASLCSQATGPAVSAVEMSYAGRIWAKIGKKLLTLTPLKEQLVATDDSVLGTIANSTLQAGEKGLSVSYTTLIESAFDPQWWSNTTQIVTFDQNGVASIHPRPKGALTTSEFTQMEANTSLIFGVAVQLYVSTLVADQSPFDQYCAAAAQGEDSTVMDDVGQGHARVGLAVFLGDVGYVDKHNGLEVTHSGHCFKCHGGPETTNASVANVTSVGLTETVLLSGGLSSALFDTGFRNTAVRPTTDDIGVGGKDPFGNPLSFVELEGFSSPAVNGAFKIPGLRNSALTGPYFHNGGKSTLMQVLNFYNGGGDFASGNAGSMDDELLQLSQNPMSAVEKAWVVDVLMAMTDPRVANQSAPFDHPELDVANGEKGGEEEVTNSGDGTAVDGVLHIPAVGQNGSKTPLKTFLGLDPHQD